MSLLILFALLCLFLDSCAVNPPNVKVYKELTPDKAYYVSTMSDDEGYIDEQHPVDGFTWWQLRPVVLSITGEDWAKIKAFIIKMCKQQNQCGQVKSWDRSVDSIDKALAK